MEDQQVAEQLRAYRALLPRVRGRLARIALRILIDELSSTRSTPHPARGRGGTVCSPEPFSIRSSEEVTG